VNLLRFFARTRKRLAVWSLVLYGLVFGFAPTIAGYVRESSSSVGENIVIMTGWLLVALMASLFAGILLADIFFPWHWRRRIILGEILPPPADAVGVEAVNATKAYMLPFSIFAVTLVILSAYTIELVTHDFFAEYQKVGYFRTVMRSDDNDAKMRIIEKMSEVQLPDEVESAVEQLSSIWNDEQYPQELRLSALDSLGVIGRSLTTSIEAWKESGKSGNRWEAKMLAGLRDSLVPALEARLAQGDTEFKEAALLAIGMMQDAGQIDRFTALVREGDVTSDQWAIAVSSLGYMRPLRALGALVEVAPKVEKAEMASLLGWAVGRISKIYPIDPLEEAPPVFSALVKNYGALLTTGNLGQRCAAADVLRYVGDADIAGYLFDAFDKAKPEEMCRTHAIKLRRTDPIFVGSEAKLRMSVLYAFRQIGKGNEDVWLWAQERAKADDMDETMKGHLNNLATSARGN
jgi:hypothetical protein